MKNKSHLPKSFKRHIYTKYEHTQVQECDSKAFGTLWYLFFRSQYLHILKLSRKPTVECNRQSLYLPSQNEYSDLDGPPIIKNQFLTIPLGQLQSDRE